jgi:3-dehydroquinate synthase
MHIFTYGPSGSGKSTVGRQLAQALAMDFVDLDAQIERALGCGILEYMQTQGEGAFREVETEQLRKAVVGSEKVIALGGGTLVRTENRTLAEASGKVVYLQAEPALLAERLADDPNQRPLLAGDLEASLKALLDERRSHYASFPLRVDASRLPQEVVWDIQRALGRFHLSSMPPAYDVIVRDGGLDDLGELLKSMADGSRVLLVSDENVAPLYAKRALRSLRSPGFTAGQFVIPAGEEHKNIETVMSLWQACLEYGLDRNSTIIALGGGVVGDLAGFCAATFMRGCRWAAVPTTLLSMVDASMGGKTGFDLPQGKNLAGAFHPPCLVLSDPDVLETLPQRQLRAGLAEVVKHGIIADPQLFTLCAQDTQTVMDNLPQIVRQAAAVKVKFIQADPYEKGIRAGLNYGHTLGHAVELVSDFSLLHGEAVAVGMVAEAGLAERLSLAHEGLANELKKVLANLGLPVEIPADLQTEALLRAMRVDKKKANGRVRFSLPEKIGMVRVGVEVEDLTEILEDVR